MHAYTHICTATQTYTRRHIYTDQQFIVSMFVCIYLYVYMCMFVLLPFFLFLFCLSVYPSNSKLCVVNNSVVHESENEVDEVEGQPGKQTGVDGELTDTLMDRRRKKKNNNKEK